ncbi:tetratricopeptide repeat protein [bacterium]|nr:tetratricopeptide repeat protein [bacterium]
MAYCPGCGAVNDEVTLSCAACGRALCVICKQCGIRNLPSSRFCSHCGRGLVVPTESASKRVVGEPIFEMISPPALGPSGFPPAGALAKLLGGGFIFAMLFLTQALTGYPILGVLASLSSCAIALWGLAEVAIWGMDQFEQRNAMNEVSMLEGNFPGEVSKGFSSLEGSFADVDKEVRLAQSQFPGTGGGQLAKPNDLVASMVSTAVYPPSLTSKEASPRKEPLSREKPERKDSEPIGSITEDDIDIGVESAHKAETLAEFLNLGIDREIAVVRKKSAKSPRNFSLLMRLAQLLEERGDLSKAVDTMAHCVSFDPPVAEVFLYYGLLLRRASEPERAKAALEKAINLNRFLAKAHYHLGVIERTMHNLPSAKERFQSCIQLTPDDAYAHYSLGMVYFELGEINLSQMELKRACILNPNDSYGHSKLGQIFYQSKQFDLAINEYSRALSIKPNDPFVLEKLGDVMVDRQNDSRAVELYQEALAHQFHPEPRTLILLAKTLQRLGRASEMKPILEEFLRLSPDNPDGLFLLSQFLISDGKFEEATVTLKKVIASNPEKSEAWIEIGKLYQSQGKVEEALTSFIKGSATAVDQADVWNTIGVLLCNKKDFEEALKAFKRAVGYDYSDGKIQSNLRMVQKKIDSSCQKVIEQAQKSLESDPNNLTCYLDMGRAFELIDRREEALMAYQKLLAIRPNSIEGLIAYAELLKKRGNLRMAMRCYREVLKIEPEHVDAHLHLVKAFLSLGFINESLRHAMSAHKISPDDPRIHYFLGNIYFAKGLAPRALKEFTLTVNTTKDPDMISWAELMRRRISSQMCLTP